MDAISENMHNYQKRVRNILPGGIHYNFCLPWEEVPLHFSKASGSTLWDMNDKPYLDFYARFGAMIVGHGHSEYNERLKDAIDRILCVSHSDIDAEVLEGLAQHIPSAEMIRFGLSGTEMIQNALRLARAWTGKSCFVRFEGHYHGNADNIMGGRAFAQKGMFTPEDFPGDFKGTSGRAPGAFEQSYLLPWNDSDILEELFIQKGDTVAAVIMEPICVNAGSILPAPGYLQKVRELCDRHHVVLIFDEVITGFRVGLGGAQTLLGVTPDLTILGKAMAGGGVPVAALAGKKEIMQLLVDKKVIHAGTFNGYPLGAAAITATLDILSRNEAQALTHMNERMSEIHHILQDRANYFELPLVIQGPPGCASYHCTRDELLTPSSYTPELMLLDIVLNTNLANHGILVSTFSRLYPNIMLNHADIEWFKNNVDHALMATKSVYEELIGSEDNL